MKTRKRKEKEWKEGVRRIYGGRGGVSEIDIITSIAF